MVIRMTSHTAKMLIWFCCMLLQVAVKLILHSNFKLFLSFFRGSYFSVMSLRLVGWLSSFSTAVLSLPITNCDVLHFRNLRESLLPTNMSYQQRKRGKPWGGKLGQIWQHNSSQETWVPGQFLSCWPCYLSWKRSKAKQKKSAWMILT